MTEDNHRSLTLSRTELGKFEVTNPRGGSLVTGKGDDADFTPGELLLIAVAACTGVDVDILTSRRADPDRFKVRVDADKMKDEQGNHLGNITLTFDIQFPDGEKGDQAREVVPAMVQRSRQRLCTVGRTVEIGTPITDKFGPVE